MSMKEIQQKLKAPKGQLNTFGNYKYRSCEDIVEAVKPLLAEHGYHLNMTDDIREVGGRVYVYATVSIMDGDKVIQSASAGAREAETKKGMDDSQITGTASSYARKYALNGLLAIDDTKDADTDEYQAKVSKAESKPETDDKPWYNDFENQKDMMLQKITSGERTAEDIVKNLRKSFKVSKQVEGQIKSLELNQADVPH
jgi:hypothetical protein